MLPFVEVLLRLVELKMKKYLIPEINITELQVNCYLMQESTNGGKNLFNDTTPGGGTPTF